MLNATPKWLASRDYTHRGQMCREGTPNSYFMYALMPGALGRVALRIIGWAER